MQSNSNTVHMIRYSDIHSSTSSPDVEDSPITTSHRNQISTMPENHLIASQICEQGHVYSLATYNNLLYTGSDSKNIQIHKNLQPLTAIKSTSGLVKAIVIFNRNKIFTGHQDGKIRIWKINPENPTLHKCVATLPTMIDVLKASARPKNYVQVRRHRSEVWIKHADAISCLSVDEGNGMLYSASWDRTFKVWSMMSLKCVESVSAHDDAVNAVVVGGGGVVYTGSADGTVKVWKRELESGNSKMVRHVLEQILLRQECAVTSLAVNESGTIVYSGSSNGLVNFWERRKKLSHGGVLRGHKMAVLSLAAAGNNLILSGSADKNICVWRRNEGVAHTCLSVLRGHTGPVKCLAVEEETAAVAEKKWVVYSGSLDKSVKVWSVSENMVPDFGSMDLMNMQECNRDFKYNWDSIPLVEY